jgi:predicted secreted hydrolase
VQPWISNQELNVSYTYWEGAVQVRGTSDGKAVTGNGYVELTGYLKSMQGQF